MEDLWLSFTKTGSVEDYLKYKNELKAQSNADENQGLDYQRTDDRRE